MVFENFSIGKKFAISLAVFLIIPLVGLFVFLNYNLLDHMNEQNYRTNLEILKQTKIPIDYMIQDIQTISMQVIQDEAVQDFLTYKDGMEESERNEYLDQIKYNLSQILNEKQHITRLVILDENQTYVQQKAYLAENVPEREEYLEAAGDLQGQCFWIPTQFENRYVSVWDRKYETAMLRAIINLEDLNQIMAYVRVNIDEAYLRSLYKGIVRDGTKRIFIMDGQGNIISSTDTSMLENGQPEISQFSEILEQGEGYLESPTEIVSFYKVDETNWYVVKVDDKSMVSQGTLFNSILLICIGMVGLFGIVFLLIQKKQIIDPLKYLSKDVSRFKEGRYAIERHSNSKDEIGRLNQAFIEMSAYIEELIEKVYKSQLKEKEAQLSYLQSQINPHFLYNTLDSLRWMALKEKQRDMAMQIEALANLFRHALNHGKEMTTVEEEIKHLEDYLIIQKNKFRERLQTHISVDEKLKSVPVLNLILQPLVENALLHGLGDKIGQGNIWISIQKENGNLIYQVVDDGVGTDEMRIREILESDDESHNALALDNINRRIKYKYGEDYGLQFYSEVGKGTKVVVKIPLEERKA